MKFMIVFTMALAAANAGMLPRELAERIMETSVLTDCWGPGNMGMYMKMVEDKATMCMNMEPMLTEADIFEQLPRDPKAAADALPAVIRGQGPNGKGPLQIGLAEEIEEGEMEHMTPEKMAMMAEKIQMLKMGKVMKISNLTCVMKEIGMWNEDETINMEFFRGMLDSQNLVEELDEDFAMMNMKKYEMCYKMSQGFPAEDIPNKGMRRFGKQMKFHKCVLKSELNVCLMKKLSDFMQTKYPEFDSEMAMKLGLPPNMYMASTMKMMMKPHLMSPTKWFVIEMMHHGEGDLFA